MVQLNATVSAEATAIMVDKGAASRAGNLVHRDAPPNLKTST